MVIISHLTKVISNVKCNRVKTGIFIVLVSSYIIIFPYGGSLRENPTDWLTPDSAFARNAISSPSLFS